MIVMKRLVKKDMAGLKEFCEKATEGERSPHFT